MQHTSKTDPHRAQRRSRPRAHAPQRTARVTATGDIRREDEHHEQADHPTAAPRRPRPTPARRRPRRARRKPEKMGWGRAALLSASGLLCLILLAMISIKYAIFTGIKAQADSKARTLAVLRERQQIAKRRLSVLESGEGHEQLLLEHGRIRPGDRFLQFPATREERRALQIPKNDVSPPPPSEDSANTAAHSEWHRAGAVLSGWWRALQGAVGIQPDKPHRPAHD